MRTALDGRTVAAGFLGALVVLAALAWLVGVEGLLASLATARPGVVVAVGGAAVVWVTAWALALRTVLRALAAPIPLGRAVAVYTGALFANNVTPFGQAGGEPVSALLISEAADTEYETALAAIASADAVNLVPSVALALVGVVFLWLGDLGRELLWATAAVVGLAVALPTVAYLAWSNRRRLEAVVGAAVTPVAQAVGGRVPRLEAPSRSAVEARVDGFVQSLEVVAADRRTLLAAVGYSALGWFAQAVALWLALYSVGVVTPVAVVLVAVPLGAVAGVTPLPGGLGGVEATLVAVLIPLAGVSAASAAAAVAIHRGAIYWLPTLVGGGVASALGAGRFRRLDV